MPELLDPLARSVMLDMELALTGVTDQPHVLSDAPEAYADALLDLARLPDRRYSDILAIISGLSKEKSQSLLGTVEYSTAARMGIWMSKCGREARSALFESEIRLDDGLVVVEREAIAPLPAAGPDVELAVRCTAFFGTMRIGRRTVELGCDTPMYRAWLLDNDGGKETTLSGVRFAPSQPDRSSSIGMSDIVAHLPGLPEDPSPAEVIRVASQVIVEHRVW